SGWHAMRAQPCEHVAPSWIARMNTSTDHIDPVTTQRSFVDSPAAYWERRLSERWGLEGVGNIGLGVAYNRWQDKQRKSVFLRDIACLPGRLKDASVLDVGSGIGFWLSVWKELGVPRITGVDVTRVAVQNLAVLHPDVRLLQLDISSGEAPAQLGQRFYAVTAVDGLSHITSDDGFAAAIGNIAYLW